MIRLPVTQMRVAQMSGALLASLLTSCGGGGGGSAPPAPVITPPAWAGFARDAQHSALGKTLAQGGIAAQSLNRIVWTASVDLAPPTTPIHYGSPLISSHNTVIVPVKTSAGGSFEVQALSSTDGRLISSTSTDYILAPYSSWIPSFGVTLTPAGRLYLPGSGGKVFYRDDPDVSSGSVQSLVFYGANLYAATPASFDASVFINTPITSDESGNVFFGFLVTTGNPAGLVSGIARIGADGAGSWVAANAALGTSASINSATNAAPALSRDGQTLYVAVATVPSSGIPTGYLLALDSTTLVTKHSTPLIDPSTLAPAWVTDSSTSSPMVGPDGDVYFGVLESNLPAHNDRGWLLHFDATLTTSKTPGSFGWDNTPSVVPAGIVASYAGPSTYLLLTKYNNYADFPAGDGLNRMAILDPNQTEADPIAGNPVMKEVMTLLGQTSDAAKFPSKPGAVKEWCVNTGAVDPITGSVFVNSEDGILYRWDLASGQISQRIQLDSGFAQAYTPTALGPDGSVYAINEGILHAIRN
jgi:hypothetical protein